MNELTPEAQAEIDALSYEQLLSAWRFAKSGDIRFQGARGIYWLVRLVELQAADPAGAVAASKNIGW